MFDLRYYKEYICLDSVEMINAQGASIARIPTSQLGDGQFPDHADVRESVKRCLGDTVDITDIDPLNKHYKPEPPLVYTNRPTP